MSTFKLTEDPIRRVSITPPPGGYLSPRKLSPIPPQGQDVSAANGWSNVAGINDNEDKFQVNLDVCSFNTHDLSVKSVGNRLIIEGKQVERQPGTRQYIAREFNLNYVLPQDVATAEMKSTLSENGVLTIEAPKVPSPKPSPTNRRKGEADGR